MSDYGTNEKAARIEQLEDGLTVDSLDAETGLPPPPDLTENQEKALWRKIDLRLVPMPSVMYFMSFMDRGNIGNANLQGLTTQLGLVGNKYNIALTMYFIPYCLCECPSNLVLKRFRPTRWLPGITILWGTVIRPQDADGPCEDLPSTRRRTRCPRDRRSRSVPRCDLLYRVGLFFGAATLAGAFSGLLAFGISFMGGTAGLLGWSWIFIVEGMATVLVGTIALFVLVDFPTMATFLTPAERSFVIHTKKYDNSSVGEEEDFALRHVWAAFTDWQVWLHVVIFMSDAVQIYGISLFLPTIIHSFGYSSAISQLLTVPPYIFATILLLIFAHWSDKLKLRYPFILAGTTISLIGYAINISDAPNGVKYFGTFFCVAGSYAPFPGMVAWLGNNLSGQYKRGVGMALHIGIGMFGGAIAANIFRTQDEPRYILGNSIELMYIGISYITIPMAVIAYRRINAQRDALMASGEGKKYTPAELRELGDRAPDFRYTI